MMGKKLKYWIISIAVSILTLNNIPCHAQPPVGYIGLFAGDHSSAWCVEGEDFYPVEMWVWCLPSFNGQICSEFAINYPSNVIRSTVTRNDAILTVTLPGCFMCGNDMCTASCCYNTCQMDWH